MVTCSSVLKFRGPLICMCPYCGYRTDLINKGIVFLQLQVKYIRRHKIQGVSGKLVCFDYGLEQLTENQRELKDPSRHCVNTLVVIPSGLIRKLSVISIRQQDISSLALLSGSLNGRQLPSMACLYILLVDCVSWREVHVFSEL